ncbi:MAG: hypothetical protein J3Q66DRAFT_407721 [Benniella sp.]|nr:MAG: hypothetical protein J3Q66DRAFT_407715 [Benniella sp.]KAK3805329.1 MAG: hypothetical protein J3Q66DRAFT_407721 [Benniella sp.]
MIKKDGERLTRETVGCSSVPIGPELTPTLQSGMTFGLANTIEDVKPIPYKVDPTLASTDEAVCWNSYLPQVPPTVRRVVVLGLWQPLLAQHPARDAHGIFLKDPTTLSSFSDMAHIGFHLALWLHRLWMTPTLNLWHGGNREWSCQPPTPRFKSSDGITSTIVEHGNTTAPKQGETHLKVFDTLSASFQRGILISQGKSMQTKDREQPCVCKG